MDYKYHHEVLRLLFDKEIEYENVDNRGKTIQSPAILPSQFSAKMLSKELNIKNVEKARAVLTSLRECDCLKSHYITKEKDVFFWITDNGISKYFERYFVYKKKEQFKEKLSTVLKILFYSISTIGIIISIVYNFLNTRMLIDKIDNNNSKEITQPFDKGSLMNNQVDSTKVIQISESNN